MSDEGREIDSQAELEALLVDRRIIGAERGPTEPWNDGQNTVTLSLDDGSQVEFMGWGHDASGCIATYYPGPR